MEIALSLEHLIGLPCHLISLRLALWNVCVLYVASLGLSWYQSDLRHQTVV